MEEKIRVILVDDQLLWRQAFGTLLNTLPYIRIIGDASDGGELMELLKLTHTDVIFLDIEMPGINGLDTLKLLNEHYPEIKVIMLSFHFDVNLAEYCLNNGASAYLPKSVGFEAVILTIDNVFKNGDSIELSKVLANKFTKQLTEHLSEKYGLNKRELEVLYCVCKGNSNKSISTILGLAERTIEQYKTNIYRKTGSKSLADIVAFGLGIGIT